MTFTVTLEDSDKQGLVVMMGDDAVDAEDRKGNDGSHEKRYELDLVPGANTIDLMVTSEDDEEKDYQLVVRRGLPPPPPSADATLSALSLSGVVTLSPTFASATGTYTADVAHSVASTTVTATETESGARSEISPDDADDATSGHQVDLGVGETVITVTVTAENGVATMEYEVTVTRASAPPTTSSDATLSTLELSGVTLDPAFDPADDELRCRGGAQRHINHGYGDDGQYRRRRRHRSGRRGRPRSGRDRDHGNGDRRGRDHEEGVYRDSDARGVNDTGD